MLCNSSLIIIRGIFLLPLTRKQKKVIEALRGRNKCSKLRSRGSRNHLGVSKRAEEEYKQKLKETTGEGALP